MRHLTRLAATVAAGLLVVTAAGPASAAPADLSGGWLSRQLADGLVHNEQYGFDDYGLTADTAFALAAIGGHRSHLDDIGTALAGKVDSWTTGVDWGSDDVYAGSVAKALVVAQVTGVPARDFGGVNLVQRLNGRVSTAAPTVGRIEDRTSGTDFANTIGQAFAARGLARAGSGKADEAVRFLLKQQCEAGYFRLNFAPADRRKQGCDAGTAAESAPDTDVTALAVLNLDALPRRATSNAVRVAVADATAWLKRAQKRNGSLGGGTATEASNANSTGLAAWALGETGSCRKAREAARWVNSLQVRGDVSGTPLAGERGGIAYDRAAYDSAQQDGIGTAERDQWRRATTQAAPGLRYLSCG